MVNVKVASKKGFTLIELIIVIVLLSVLGIMTTNYIKTGTDIYTSIVNLNKSLSNLQFVMERLRREINHALPSSLIIDNNCLTFTPIIDSSFYGNDFPIGHRSSNNAFIVPIESYLKGTKAVVNLLTASELLDGTGKVRLITDYDLKLGKLTFENDLAFPSSSPNNRIYFIKNNITYCFKDSSLYKRINNNEAILMTENITGLFIDKASISKSAPLNESANKNAVQVTFTMLFDDQEVSVEQLLHIKNKP